MIFARFGAVCVSSSALIVSPVVNRIQNSKPNGFSGISQAYRYKRVIYYHGGAHTHTLMLVHDQNIDKLWIMANKLNSKQAESAYQIFHWIEDKSRDFSIRDWFLINSCSLMMRLQENLVCGPFRSIGTEISNATEGNQAIDLLHSFRSKVNDNFYHLITSLIN